MAKARKKPRNNSPSTTMTRKMLFGAAACTFAMISATLKVPNVLPIHKIASSIKIEPAIVYRKNLTAA